MLALVLKIRERKMINRLIRAGAINKENAVAIDEIDVRLTPIFMKLKAKGIIIESTVGKYYIDTKKY